jgi:hypothetical protein
VSYGQLVGFDYGWVGQTRRPVLDLRPYEASMALRATLTSVTRIAGGTAIGAAFGATTSYPVLWVVVGAAIGWGFNLLRQRARR